MQLWPTVKTTFIAKPQVAKTPMVLPGMRFGMLSPSDRPSDVPKKLHLEADVEKRDEIREAFEVGLLLGTKGSDADVFSGVTTPTVG